jgi:DNA-binding CsgD family transcriptional regulator
MRAENENLLIFWTLVGSGSFAVFDIISDFQEKESWTHIATEIFLTTLTFACVLLLWRRKRGLDLKVKKQKLLVEEARASQQQSAADAMKWRQEASILLKGLSGAIDKQLEIWDLTLAEKEVALLLLKGLSLKEVAEIRGVSEKTARAQSFSIYSKSGLNGRAQLSAFFLEDLMLPYKPNQPDLFF